MKNEEEIETTPEVSRIQPIITNLVKPSQLASSESTEARGALKGVESEGLRPPAAAASHLPEMLTADHSSTQVHNGKGSTMHTTNNNSKRSFGDIRASLAHSKLSSLAHLQKESKDNHFSSSSINKLVKNSPPRLYGEDLFVNTNGLMKQKNRNETLQALKLNTDSAQGVSLNSHKIQAAQHVVSTPEGEQARILSDLINNPQALENFQMLIGQEGDPMEINETCFFKNEQHRQNFENTKSHDALFQQSIDGAINNTRHQLVETDIRKDLEPQPERIIRPCSKHVSSSHSPDLSNRRGQSYEEPQVNRFAATKQSQSQAIFGNPLKQTSSSCLGHSPGGTQPDRPDRQPRGEAKVMTRSISVIQNRPGQRTFHQSDTRVSPKRNQSVNQLYDNYFSQSNSVFPVCRDQSPNSNSRRLNHNIIKDQIKSQARRPGSEQGQTAYNSYLQVPFTSQEMKQDSSGQIYLEDQQQEALEPEVVEGVQPLAQTGLPTSTQTWSQFPNLTNKNLPEYIHFANEEPHRVLTQESQERLNSLIDEALKSQGVAYGTQQHLTLLRNLQKNLLLSQEGACDPSSGDYQTIMNAVSNLESEAKGNLRNYFIQSSLTFNGNNLNSKQTKSMSGGGTQSYYDQAPHGEQMTQRSDSLPQINGPSSEEKLPRSLDQQRQSSTAVADESRLGLSAVREEYTTNGYGMDQDGQKDGTLNNMKLLRQFQTQQQNAAFLSKDSMVDSRVFQAGAKGAVQNNIGGNSYEYFPGQMSNEVGIFGQGGTTSGFLSGAGLNGLQAAFQGEFEEGSICKPNSQIFLQENQVDGESSNIPIGETAQNTHHNSAMKEPAISQTNSEMADQRLQEDQMISSALEPDRVFDLPSAVQELQRAFGKIDEVTQLLQASAWREERLLQEGEGYKEKHEEVQRELIHVESQKLLLEQELLDLMEQLKLEKEANAGLQQKQKDKTGKYFELQTQFREVEAASEQLKGNLALQQEANAGLREQVEYLQQQISIRDAKCQSFEDENNFLKEKDLRIEQTVNQLRQRYQDKLAGKTQEYDELRVSFLELQKHCQDQANIINELQHRPPSNPNQQYTYPSSQHNQINSQYTSGMGGESSVPFVVSSEVGAETRENYVQQHLFDGNLEQHHSSLTVQNEMANKSHLDPKLGNLYNEGEDIEQPTADPFHMNQVRSQQPKPEGQLRLYKNSDRSDCADFSDVSRTPQAPGEQQSIQKVKSESVIFGPSRPQSSRQNQGSHEQLDSHSKLPHRSPRMHFSPMTREIGKLREHISTLVDSMAKMQAEQNNQINELRRSKHSRHTSSASQIDIEYRDSQIRLMQDFKQMLNSENKDLRQLIKDYSDKLLSMQETTQGLKIENARLQQDLHAAQAQIAKAESVRDEISCSQAKEDIKRKDQAYKQVRELEQEMVRQKLEKYREVLEQKQQLLELTKKYDSQLRDLKAALGFVFGIVGLNRSQVPKSLSDKLFSEIADVRIGSSELLAALQNFEGVLSEENEARAKLAKLRGLKQENKELVRMVAMEQKQRRLLQNQLQEFRGNTRVVCRVRPMLLQELRKSKSSEAISVLGSGKVQITSHLQNQCKLFEFDRIFHPTSSQSDVFEEVQPLVQSAMEGFNVCVMAYGQTGSGKTYSMVGDDQNPGLYFSTVDEIYRLIKARSSYIDYQISVSVIEVYNERIKDLLAKSKPVRIQEDSDGALFGDQTRRKVHSKNQILKALRDACYNRTVGITQFNEYSSRSHFVLTIFITAYDRISKQVLSGKMNLVDLAGSERILNTNAEGVRIKEAQNINKSLATLGKVFLSLSNKQSHVPYRESKLTHYLKDSLGGNAKTMMLLQVSPNSKDQGESLSTLAFGERAQSVVRGRVIPLVHNPRQLTSSFLRKSTLQSSHAKRSVKKPLARSVSAMSRVPSSGQCLGSEGRGEARKTIIKSLSNSAIRKKPSFRQFSSIQGQPSKRSRSKSRNQEMNSKTRKRQKQSSRLGMDDSSVMLKERPLNYEKYLQSLKQYKQEMKALLSQQEYTVGTDQMFRSDTNRSERKRSSSRRKVRKHSREEEKAPVRPLIDHSKYQQIQEAHQAKEIVQNFLAAQKPEASSSGQPSFNPSLKSTSMKASDVVAPLPRAAPEEVTRQNSDLKSLRGADQLIFESNWKPDAPRHLA